ncbi:MAG: DUF2520 domain-containing protein [Aeromicrobium sp.]|uniref:Rossmann-like and DUF2520 domain-containing protein n=1 Tax=Aeromicrobium sp. TaxID=1871063 RepID=UPI0039E53933
MKRIRSALGVVGSGRVGAVLGARLRAAGHPVVGVSARSGASQLRAGTLLPGVPVAEPAEVVAACDVLLLAVPDDALEAVAAELAPHVRPGQLVLHTSGRHGRAVLAAMAAAGARTAAFHPAMTFTGSHVDLDRGCVMGLTAEPADRAEVAELAQAVGGTPVWIAEADRVVYHAALAHGANHIVTVVNQAMDLLRSIGVSDPSAVLEPLLSAALTNTLAYGDAALTGPVARGDVGTVREHVAAIADPEIADTYAALSSATVGRAVRDRRLDEAAAAELRAALTKETQS